MSAEVGGIKPEVLLSGDSGVRVDRFPHETTAIISISTIAINGTFFITSLFFTNNISANNKQMTPS
jgi:hypothetical protein